MPPFEEDRWDVIMAALSPIFGSLFLMSELGLVEKFNRNWYLWIVYGVVILSISALILYKGQRKNLAASYSGVLAAVTLLVSVFWLNLISSLIVDFLAFIQVVTGLSLYFLSVTMLAWGNSLEDYFVNFAIAKKGYGRTALGGVYGSQIFAVLIGFGGGIFRSALTKPVVLNLYSFTTENMTENLMTLFLLGSTCLVLVLTLVGGSLTKWILGKKMTAFILMFYVVFVMGITSIAFI